MPADAYRRAQRLAELGRYAEARHQVRSGLAEFPADAPLLTLLASILRAERDYAAALTAADAAISADPVRSDGYAERAECLIVLLRGRDAIEPAREATRLDPLHPAGHLVLARALAAARDYEQARAAAAYGLSLAPRSVEALLTVADVERDAGNRERATEAARAALAVSPDNPYGRWLIAMLDAERLEVRRSMRGLRDVVRDHPANPDLVSMTWPIRGVLTGLRRGLWIGSLLVLALAAAGAWWWSPLGTFARIVAAVVAAVLVGFAARVLIPAGRLPWRCLKLLPRLMFRADVAGLGTVVVAVLLLTGYALLSWWILPLLALACAPLLWAFGFLEMLGAGLDDPGFRHALSELAGEFRDWWQTTRTELRAAWKDDPPPR